jgi:hypothetical protein
MTRHRGRPLTGPEVSRRYGLPDHTVSRLARKGHLELPRFGRYYVVDEAELPAVEKVLYKRGLLHGDDHADHG